MTQQDSGLQCNGKCEWKAWVRMPTLRWPNEPHPDCPVHGAAQPTPARGLSDKDLRRVIGGDPRMHVDEPDRLYRDRPTPASESPQGDWHWDPKLVMFCSAPESRESHVDWTPERMATEYDALTRRNKRLEEGLREIADPTTIIGRLDTQDIARRTLEEPS